MISNDHERTGIHGEVQSTKGYDTVLGVLHGLVPPSRTPITSKILLMKCNLV